MKIRMQKELNEIKELLVSFSRYIELENSNGEFGINKTAENIISGLLNIVFESELENVNKGKVNYQGIDLVDTNKRIAFQITSDNDRNKILNTLRIIDEYKLYLQFDEFYIYILSKKKKYRNLQRAINEITNNRFPFFEKDIVDYEDIYKILGNCQDINKIITAREYLESHIVNNDKVIGSLSTQIREAEAKELNYMLSENSFFASVKTNGESNGYSEGISEKLFPRGFIIPQYYEGYGVSEEGIEKPLSDLYHEYRDENLILLGEGGIGKTTFLMHMMKSFYVSKNEALERIPVYIELNRCSVQIGRWYSSRYKKTNFITRYIAALLDGGDYDKVSESRLIQIEEELRRSPKDGIRKYVLLLDGFNEVSRNQTESESGTTGQSIRETLRREISVLSTYGNIKLILTSRRMDKTYLPTGFEVLYLKGLNITDIRNYLQEINYSEIEINEIEMSSELVGCLQVPLFLCMFACRNKNKKVRPLTRGEILYNFFHKESPFYGEQKNIKKSFSRDYSEQLLISFIMDFILPYIGNMMEECGEFHINRSDVLEWIETFLEDDEVPFWNPEIEVFREYEEEELLENVLRKIKDVPKKKIMDCMVGTLGILNYDGRGGYSFIHHHIRDYFSSVYEIQWLRCAVALSQKEKKRKEPSSCVLDALGSIRYEVWAEVKQIFIGEILSEHRNAPYVDSQGRWTMPEPIFKEQRLLREIMDIFRNNQAYPGRCIFNIVEIFKKVRKNLSGENFSGLDLRDCRFYETVCSIGERKQRLTASFKNAILSNDTFHFDGHLGCYEDFEIFEDKAYTLGSDGRVLLWDLETYQCRMSFDVGNTFYPDTHVEDKQIVVGKAKNFLIKSYEYEYKEDGSELGYAEIRCYNELSQEYVSMECPVAPRGIWDMCYSASGNFVASVWEDNYISIYDCYDGSTKDSFLVETEGEIKHISMPADDILILHIEDEEREIEETDNDEIYRSNWSFEMVSLQTMEVTHIISYETMYTYNNEYQRPAFSFSESGWETLIFEDGKVKILNLKGGTHIVVQELPDGIIPESVRFLTNVSKYVAIYYQDNYILWNLFEKTNAIYSGKVLEYAKKVVFGMDSIYVMNSALELEEWNIFEEDKVRKIFPQVELNIIGITCSTKDGELCVQYSNNSIIIIDENTGELKTSIYYPEFHMEMEYCEYISEKHLLFMVFANMDKEEIVIYSLENGQSKKLHVNFRSRLHFHGAIVNSDKIYIAFDRKVVEVNLDDFQMCEVWSAEADIEILSINEKFGQVGILKKEKVCQGTPYYDIYQKKEDGQYSCIGRRAPILVSEKQAQQMIPLTSQEFTGYSDNGLSLFHKLGIFLEWDEEVNDIYEKNGRKPWELSKIFYYVSDFGKHISLKGDIQQHLQLGEITEKRIVIIENYSKVQIYEIKDERVVFMTRLSIAEKENEAILDACVDDVDRVYCRLEDDTLISVDLAGKIIREYNWMPGLIIAGCDFSGARASESVKDILKMHGGLIS